MAPKRKVNPSVIQKLQGKRGPLAPGQVMKKKPRVIPETNVQTFIDAGLTASSADLAIVEISSDKGEEVPEAVAVDAGAQSPKAASPDVPLRSQDDGPSILLDPKVAHHRVMHLACRADRKLLSEGDSFDLVTGTIADAAVVAIKVAELSRRLERMHDQRAELLKAHDTAVFENARLEQLRQDASKRALLAEQAKREAEAAKVQAEEAKARAEARTFELEQLLEMKSDQAKLHERDMAALHKRCGDLQRQVSSSRDEVIKEFRASEEFSELMTTMYFNGFEEFRVVATERYPDKIFSDFEIDLANLTIAGGEEEGQGEDLEDDAASKEQSDLPAADAGPGSAQAQPGSSAAENSEKAPVDVPN